MATKTKNQTISEYILSCIDSVGYGKVTATENEKLQFLADTFKDEYCYPENLKRYGSKQAVFTQWIMGLPSSFNIEFENVDILSLGRRLGLLPVNAAASTEDRFLANYFTLISCKVFALFIKKGIQF